MEQIKTINSLLQDKNKLIQFSNDRFNETDLDKSNEVNRSELRKALENISQMLNLPHPDDNFTNQVLTQFDKDKSGNLDREEFQNFTLFVLENMYNVYSKQIKN